MGRLSALSIFLWKYILYGAFVWARRALNIQKRRLPARAVKEYVYHFRQLALANRSVEDIDPARPPARQELVPSALAPPRSVPGVFHICILALDRLIYHGVCTLANPWGSAFWRRGRSPGSTQARGSGSCGAAGAGALGLVALVLPGVRGAGRSRGRYSLSFGRPS